MMLPITWILEDQLAQGQMISSQNDIDSLRARGISVIINLRQSNYDEMYNLDGIELHHLPIADFSTPTAAQARQFIDIVNSHLNDQDKIYVHCTAGCGRSGTMVALYLCSMGKFDTPAEAISYLRELRPCAIETEEQENFVLKIGLKLIS